MNGCNFLLTHQGKYLFKNVLIYISKNVTN